MFLVFFGSIGLAVSLIAPIVYDEFRQLQEIVSASEVRKGIRDFEYFLGKNLSFLGIRRMPVTPKLEAWVGGIFDNILNIASGIVGLVLFVVMLMISTFFLLKDGRALKKSFIAIVPNRFFEMTLGILHKVDWSIGAYLRGIFLDALVIGVVSAVAMWLIKIPNFFLVGLVAGVFNLVPYLGPPTACLVACSISAISLGNFSQTPLIIFLFAVIRLFDDSVVQPLTIAGTVQLHPLIIIFALLIGGELFGIIGMLFAVPVAGVMKVVLSELLNGLQRFRTVHTSSYGDL